MRIVRAVWVALLLAACGLRAGEPSPTGPFDGARALRAVEAQLAFGPRFPGSVGHESMQAWIPGQLGEVGWQVQAQRFENEGVALRNFLATRPGELSTDILLGAHYDTRPVADRDAQAPQQPVPGANDGASGVAVLVELARTMPPDLPGCDIGLAFFDAEDSGGLDGWEWALGSRHFVAQMTYRPSAVVVVDMVGDRQLEVYIEQNSDRPLAEEIWGVGMTLGYQAFRPQAKYSILDDHTAFLEKGIPAVDIIDFDYPYWHTTEDTFDKVSAESLEAVGRTLASWLVQRCR